MNKYVFIIIVLAICLRLVGLGQSFWLDEAAQVIESSRSFSQQFQIVADFHPPGFHILLHMWMWGGQSEKWVRTLSILLSIGSIVGIFFIARSMYSYREALLAAFFLTISPYHIWYSQEARPYMMLIFFSTWATYFFLTEKWLWYASCAVGMLYSTYFAPFVLLSHMCVVYLYQRKSLKEMLTAVSVALLFFLPWLPFFFHQLIVGTNGAFAGWDTVVSFTPIKGILLVFAKFIFGKGSIDDNRLYGLIVFPVFLLFLVSVSSIRRTLKARILLLFFFIPLFSVFLVTLVIPVLAPQRMTFLLPFFYLILSLGILHIRSPFLRIVSIMAVVLTSFFGIMQYYTDNTVQREQWRDAVEYTAISRRDDAISLFVFPDPFAPFLWYTKGMQDGVGIAPHFHLEEQDLNRLQVLIAGKKRVFFWRYLTGLTDPNHKVDAFFSQEGYHIVEEKNFEGVGIISAYENK